MDLFKRLNEFYADFSLEKGILGYSVKNQPIYYFCVKKTERPRVIATYSIHAREHITCKLALLQIKDYVKNGTSGTVYFVPMLNPDGVKIALNLIPLYKANANGVDLNVNFDAEWGKGKHNVTIRGAENYIGKHPFSEPETSAIRDFTLKTKPDATLSYHCKGEEIYYKFRQSDTDIKRDYKLAKAVADITGYKIKDALGSVGGYKDWCIQKLKIPSLTIEVGDDKLLHPLLTDCLKEIYKKNKKVIKVITENPIWT